MARPQQPTTQKKPDGGNAAPPMALSGAPQAADVAKRAYELWVASGRPQGKDQEHWFQAERELKARKQVH
jgi:hypothetical protein